MVQPEEPPFIADAICFDLLTALLDSWSLWEEVAAEAGNIGQGQPWRHAALRLVTRSGDYRPYGELAAAAAREVGLAPDLADVLLARWGNSGHGRRFRKCWRASSNHWPRRRTAQKLRAQRGRHIGEPLCRGSERRTVRCLQARSAPIPVGFGRIRTACGAGALRRWLIP